MNLLKFLKKTPQKVSQPKPKRISITLSDGSVVVHKAAYRTVKPDGRLSLHVSKDGGHIVAEYNKDYWLSLSVGKRSVFKQNEK